MKTYLFVLPLIIIFVMGFVADSSVAREPIGYEVSKLLGSVVQNPQGEQLGTIKDFIVDSNGRIEFAILLQRNSKAEDGRDVVIPFDALSPGPSAHRFVLNTTSEKLSSAPRFDQKHLTNPEFADEVYKYFGLGPYWTEQGRENWRRSDQDPFDLVG